MMKALFNILLMMFNGSTLHKCVDSLFAFANRY
jgi:hypothetical protein